MVSGSCHCGAVTIELDVAPAEITECNCSICRRYGVLWAYYAPRQVRFATPCLTDVYMWDDRALRFHRCRGCGCVTHWSAVDAAVERMGVNARLFDPAVIAAARRRAFDGAVTGTYRDP